MTVAGFKIDSVAESHIEEQVYTNLVKLPNIETIPQKERNTGHHDPLRTFCQFRTYGNEMYALAKGCFSDNHPVWRYAEEVFLRSLAKIIKEKGQGRENAIRDFEQNWKEEWNQDFEDWYDNLSAKLFPGRTVVKTEKGFLGLAPDFSARGDVVAVLQGLTTLALLRPRDDEKKSYMWIGEAWISEYMDGRAVDDFFSKIYHAEFFRLT